MDKPLHEIVLIIIHLAQFVGMSSGILKDRLKAPKKTANELVG
jgi:hypothetical protein